MFAIIYQAHIKLELESEFRGSWNKIANYFISHRGVIGACLHKTENGIWLAYVRWPDRNAKITSWPVDSAPAPDLPNDIKEAIIKMKQCMDLENRIPEISMEVMDDLLK